MRQGVITEYDPRRGCSVATLSYEYPAGFNVPEHAHGSDQVIFAVRGVMEVAAGQSLWVVPPHFAIWIPAGTLHCIRMPGAVSMRTLYVRRGLAQLSARCGVLNVTPLLRELIVEAVRIGQLRTCDRLHCAVRDLLLSNLRSASPVPTHVALPQDARALSIAQEFIRNPEEPRRLALLCDRAGVSVRTIERVFRREVGTDFETWRRHVRLMKAVELLAGGSSVKQVAFDIGYNQPSAFVTMFRKAFGVTPRAWMNQVRP